MGAKDGVIRNIWSTGACRVRFPHQNDGVHYVESKEKWKNCSSCLEVKLAKGEWLKAKGVESLRSIIWKKYKRRCRVPWIYGGNRGRRLPGHGAGTAPYGCKAVLYDFMTSCVGGRKG